MRVACHNPLFSSSKEDYAVEKGNGGYGVRCTVYGYDVMDNTAASKGYNTELYLQSSEKRTLLGEDIQYCFHSFSL